MAPKAARQDRQLQRQRGAGTRQVRNLSFGLQLPGQDNAPLQPRKSGRGRQTPGTAKRPSSRLFKTPAQASTKKSASKRTSAAALSATRNQRARSDSTQPAETQPTSTKRKRETSEDVSEAEQISRNERSSIKRHKSTGRNLPKIDEGENAVVSSSRMGGGSASASKPEAAASQTAQKRRKKRKSIGQQSMRKSKRKSEVDSSTKPTQKRNSTNRKSGIGHNDDPPELYDNPVSTPSSEAESDEEEGDTVLPTIGEEYHSGKSPTKGSGRLRLDRRADGDELKEEFDEEQPSLVHDISEHEPQALDDDDIDVGNDSDGEQETQMKNAGRLHATNRQSLSNAPRNTTKSSRPTAPEGVKRKLNDTTGPRRQEAPVRRRSSHAQAPHAHMATTSTSRAAKRHSFPPPPPPPPGSIPITVYRPAEDEDNSEAEYSLQSSSDELDRPISTYPRSSGSQSNKAARGFNSVDVLAQITLERMEKYQGKLSSNPSATHIQRKALDLFAQELDNRMRQLSSALDTRAALQERLKRVRKEERSLKRNVKDVQAQRKEIGAVLVGERKRKRKLDLDGLLGRIAQVARLGWEMERRGKL